MPRTDEEKTQVALAMLDGMADLWFAESGFAACNFPDPIVRAIKQAHHEGLYAGRCSILDEQWQPISRAPKDGTWVLLYSPDCETGPFIGQWHDDEGQPDGGAWWGDAESSWPIDADPSHWRQLPKPPTHHVTS